MIGPPRSRRGVFDNPARPTAKNKGEAKHSSGGEALLGRRSTPREAKHSSGGEALLGRRSTPREASTPRSHGPPWERTLATLRVAPPNRSAHKITRDAERPDVRSHGGPWERGARGEGCKE